MPVTDFLTWRFALATLAMVVLRPARGRRGCRRAGRRAGALLGLALGTGYLLQTLGLQTTPASVSGFLTGMFVVLTPLGAAALLRHSSARAGRVGGGRRGDGRAGAAVAAGVSRSAPASCSPSAARPRSPCTSSGWAAGRARTTPTAWRCCSWRPPLCCAPWSPSPAVWRGPPDGRVWAALALTSLAATALAYVVQTWAQAHLSPTRTAVVMTMEPVFALGFAVVVAGEQVGPRTLAGAALVLLAMLLTELGPRAGAEGAVERLEV